MARKKSRHTKHERKELKRNTRREKREKERLERERKEKRDRWIKYGVIILIILVSGFYLYKRDTRLKNPPRIVIEPSSYNFQDISVAGGVVKTSMAIKNEGKSDLLIDDMDSSCGCTTATITKDGKEGPVFGMKMHGTNPIGWSETLKPGETAELNIYYDPQAHPDLRGHITRVITVFSNDPKTSKKIVKIEVNQVD